tara:strand:+ start:336 stop:626 length:291 start_codon:yes stop_codon:yes gene_type:complete
MVNVYKESEFYAEQTVEPPPVDPTFEGMLGANPFTNFQGFMFSGLKNLSQDFGEVTQAAKNFPYRSAFTVIGVIAVLYIGFKISRSFVKITSRLRG